MSLKRNILANYASQIYVTLISIVMVPLYLKYMGAEAFGLVGFFAMLQMWFNLLDMGLTPTMARETARYRGGAMDAITFRRLERSLEWLFLIVAVLGGGLLLTVSGWVATSWLNAQRLLISEVQIAIQLMAISVSLRWMSGLYRGQISGAERLVWLSGYNASIATIRFIGVMPVLMFISITPTAFFSYQLCAASIELVGLIVMAYRLLPPVPPGERLAWSWEPLQPVLKFSLTMAIASMVWVVVTQTDKLLLSTLLPLAEYGYFTLAVLVASGVMMISGPVSGAIMPHMAKLEAEGDHAGLICVYRQSTQLVAVIAGAAAITVAFCAEPLLWAWTGDITLAHQAAPIMILYAIGNGILAISAFPYYLQYAKGDLRLHLIGNAFFVVMMIPAIIWAVSQYGGVGAGYVWMAMNAIYFFAWVPLVHSRFDSRLNVPWFGRDVLSISVVAALAGYGLFVIMPHANSRLGLAVEVVGFGLLVMLAGACASSVVWGKAKMWLEQRQMKQEGSI
jgi:O-antigen/teichoic acid export membrane protein